MLTLMMDSSVLPIRSQAFWITHPHSYSIHIRRRTRGLFGPWCERERLGVPTKSDVSCEQVAHSYRAGHQHHGEAQPVKQNTLRILYPSFRASRSGKHEILLLTQITMWWGLHFPFGKSGIQIFLCPTAKFIPRHLSNGWIERFHILPPLWRICLCVQGSIGNSGGSRRFPAAERGWHVTSIIETVLRGESLNIARTTALEYDL